MIDPRVVEVALSVGEFEGDVARLFREPSDAKMMRWRIGRLTRDDLRRFADIVWRRYQERTA